MYLSELIARRDPIAEEIERVIEGIHVRERYELLANKYVRLWEESSNE